MLFLSSAESFSKSTFSINSFRNTIRVSNILDPDQGQHFVGPDLGPNCLQRLSTNGTSRQRVISSIVWPAMTRTCMGTSHAQI